MFWAMDGWMDGWIAEQEYEKKKVGVAFLGLVKLSTIEGIEGDLRKL